MDKILIVDDENDIVENLVDYLQAKGFATVTARNGEEALRLTKQEFPDLILMDITMPIMDGIETTRLIRSCPESAEVPILLLTALNGSEKKVNALAVGANDYITKPFHEPELLARVQAFLRTKTLHDKLKASYKKLEEMEKIKDFLIQSIIHDLRNPLTTFHGSVQLLIENLNDPSHPYSQDEVRRLLSKAAVSAQEEMRLIQNILDVHKLEDNRLELNRSKVDFNALIESCASAFETQSQAKRVSLRKELNPNLPDLALDEELMQRVIKNLIGNALKFTPEGGSMTVRSNIFDQELSCEVADSGAGIPEKDLDKIFEKFFQSGDQTSKRRGYGLGLTFCQLAVQAHGGKIWAENIQGTGAKLKFTLPIQ